MPSIKILSSVRVDNRDSAFPMAVQLPDGDILCTFCVGGGQFIHGGTEQFRSRDRGATWTADGIVCPTTKNPDTSNFLKPALSPDKKTIYAYGSVLPEVKDLKFGERMQRPIFCVSTDAGKTWSPPRMIPQPVDCPMEISYSLVVLPSGRLLAPMAILHDKQKLGEKVVTAVSEDGGKTWPEFWTVFEDPEGKHCYWEHKFTSLGGNRLMSVCWTVTRGEYKDQPDSFRISEDGGKTWRPIRSTGIMGQTMCPIWLGGDRLLVLYNRRYGQQGIVMNLVRFTEDRWTVEFEGLMYDPRSERQRADGVSGVDELKSFQFGFPTAIRLDDGTYLATHWSVEGEFSGIRAHRLQID